MDKLQKIIFCLFCILLFLVPLILWPTTSEVFEFNKMVLVYALTTLIVGCWLTSSLLVKKFIFRRTILDIPLLFFLGSQFISTIFSMDPRTSWLGYYSRFNGGLASTICYSLLYWAFVCNIDRKKALKLIYVTLTSAALVSIYGILEHFGIDKNIWVQDVQSRVFSTLGQPNWLAAWLVALIPLTWAGTISNFQTKNVTSSVIFKRLILHILSILFFIVLLFTGSRSGLLGFAVAFGIFWIFSFLKDKKEILRPFAVISFSLLVLSLIIGTQYTPSIKSLLSKQITNNQIVISQGTALETGGTESGTIRRIVWKGAIQVWLHHPIFGTGVETFAYSYYLYRPVEHNLTSEWDFIYNKAHNEFLNVAANSGTVGLLSYLFLIGTSIYLIVKKLDFPSSIFHFPFKSKNQKIENKMDNDNWQMVNAGLLAGYISLLVTNFFGFSVVPTQLLFFLFPAIAVTLAISEKRLAISETKTNTNQKVLILVVLIATGYLLITISKYWYADYLYAQGKSYNSIKRPDIASKYLIQATNLEPNQALYYRDLSTSYANIALALNQQKETNEVAQISNTAIVEINKAINLSPADVNTKRIAYSVYMTLLPINSNYLINAKDSLISAIAQAPTDAKLYYYLGLTYARTNQIDLSLETLQKAIDLKSDYKEARDAYDIIGS